MWPADGECDSVLLALWVGSDRISGLMGRVSRFSGVDGSGHRVNGLGGIGSQKNAPRTTLVRLSHAPSEGHIAMSWFRMWSSSVADCCCGTWRKSSMCWQPFCCHVSAFFCPMPTVWQYYWRHDAMWWMSSVLIVVTKLHCLVQKSPSIPLVLHRSACCPTCVDHIPWARASHVAGTGICAKGCRHISTWKKRWKVHVHVEGRQRFYKILEMRIPVENCPCQMDNDNNIKAVYKYHPIIHKYKPSITGTIESNPWWKFNILQEGGLPCH